MTDNEEVPNMNEMRNEAHKEALRKARETDSGTSTAMDSRPAKPRKDDIELSFFRGKKSKKQKDDQ